MRELRFERSGRLAWHERAAPALLEATDVIVRPFVGGICGKIPFRGPFAIGHECVAEIVELGSQVTGLRAGQRVIVPWAVSCGTCPPCRRGLTAKCATTTGGGVLAAYGFGPASGPWGGMVTDALRVPFAEHMLVPVPAGIPAERVAAASDNLADAWRAVVLPLAARAGGSVLILGGGAKSIGLYAAGLAVAHGASTVDYVDDDPGRRTRGVGHRRPPPRHRGLRHGPGPGPAAHRTFPAQSGRHPSGTPRLLRP